MGANFRTIKEEKSKSQTKAKVFGKIPATICHPIIFLDSTSHLHYPGVLETAPEAESSRALLESQPDTRGLTKA